MSRPSIQIGERRIGADQPCFVIAEIGVNHDGDVAMARQLIDAAVTAGADAVKFQTFAPAALAAADAPKADYQRIGDPAVSQREMLSRLALDEAAHVALKHHADAAGTTFLSSPFDEHSVDLLERLGVPAYKVPSGEITNLRLLRRIAAAGKPVLLSTGMSTLDEVAVAVAALSASPAIALLHCVSVYPAEPGDCNLRAMDALRARFDRPVGWSDHTPGTAVAIAAAALGANVIEKHLTLSRDLPGPDHASSLEPAELRAMIDGIRAVEAALGNGEKRPVAAEAAIAAVARKSAHWARALPAGHQTTEADVVALRPGTGISAARIDDLVGRRLRRAVSAGRRVEEDDVE